jgi:hypothetical protein
MTRTCSNGSNSLLFRLFTAVSSKISTLVNPALCCRALPCKTNPIKHPVHTPPYDFAETASLLSWGHVVIAPDSTFFFPASLLPSLLRPPWIHTHTHMILPIHFFKPYAIQKSPSATPPIVTHKAKPKISTTHRIAKQEKNAHALQVSKRKLMLSKSFYFVFERYCSIWLVHTPVVVIKVQREFCEDSA